MIQGEVNLLEVKEFVESRGFTEYLVNNTTDINIPLFILSALTEIINRKLEDGKE